MRAAFLDLSSLGPSDLDFTPLQACVDALATYDYTDPDQVVSRLQGIDAAIVNKVVLHADILAQLPELKHILLSLIHI